MNDMVFYLKKDVGKEKENDIDRYRKIWKILSKKNIRVSSDLLPAEMARLQTSSGLDHQLRFWNIFQRQN